MVSPLASIRLASAQLLVKTLSDASTLQETSSSSSSARTSLLASYGIDASSSSTLSGQTLSGLMNALADRQTASATTATTTGDDEENPGSKAFMANLKEMLEEMAETAGSEAQGKAMLAALKAGTLTVTDPVEGVQITAWDVDAKAEADTKSKATSAIDADGWSTFLKEHLTRTEKATYARNTDGSYVDKVTKQSAWFGTIGSTYYYLSWKAPEAAA